MMLMSLSDYLKKAKLINTQNLEKKLRVAFLSSFTINGLPETIRVKCAEAKTNCSVYLAGYNQYAQEILNDSSDLYKFKPDISFLIIDTRNILGELFFSPYSVSLEQRKDHIKKHVNEISLLVNHFTTTSKSKIIITSLAIPTYSPHGIFESKTDFGLYEMVQAFNTKLNDSIKNEPSAYLYDFNSFIRKYGETSVFDYRQFHFGDIKVSLEKIPNFADELMSYIKPVIGKNRKCIVLDLDDTLWGGVVGEEGFEGIFLGPNGKGAAYMEFQRRLLALQQRGIILAINSKNNLEDALKVIREHPHMILKEKHFACLKINWDDKVSNMKEIAQELNIGLDSLVFFDDNPVNREYFKKTLPEVLTIDLPKDPSLFAATLTNMNDFNVMKITAEDKKRGEMYLQQRKRKDIQKTSTNLDEFLNQLDTKIKIKSADQFSIPRISQLTLKTNQFNLTTHRYQEENINKFAQDNNMLVGCAQVEDKFGDNGITGVFIIDKTNSSEWILDTFLLSCRVMGRKVEEAIMGHIINLAKDKGVKKIKADYIPTKKNKPSELFLPNYGFKKEDNHWVFSINEQIEIPKCIEVKTE